MKSHDSPSTSEPPEYTIKDSRAFAGANMWNWDGSQPISETYDASAWVPDSEPEIPTVEFVQPHKFSVQDLIKTNSNLSGMSYDDALTEGMKTLRDKIAGKSSDAEAATTVNADASTEQTPTNSDTVEDDQPRELNVDGLKDALRYDSMMLMQTLQHKYLSEHPEATATWLELDGGAAKVAADYLKSLGLDGDLAHLSDDIQTSVKDAMAQAAYNPDNPESFILLSAEQNALDKRDIFSGRVLQPLERQLDQGAEIYQTELDNEAMSRGEFANLQEVLSPQMQQLLQNESQQIIADITARRRGKTANAVRAQNEAEFSDQIGAVVDDMLTKWYEDNDSRIDSAVMMAKRGELTDRLMREYLTVPLRGAIKTADGYPKIASWVEDFNRHKKYLSWDEFKNKPFNHSDGVGWVEGERVLNVENYVANIAKFGLASIKFGAAAILPFARGRKQHQEILNSWRVGVELDEDREKREAAAKKAAEDQRKREAEAKKAAE